jgi:hypothetical protein
MENNEMLEALRELQEFTRLSYRRLNSHLKFAERADGHYLAIKRAQAETERCLLGAGILIEELKHAVKAGTTPSSKMTEGFPGKIDY